MKILREFFETDFAGLPYHQVAAGQRPKTLPAEVDARVHYHFNTNSKFVSCYVPTDCPLEPAGQELLASQDEIFSSADASLEWIQGRPGDVASPPSELRFSGRVFLYHDERLTNDVGDYLRQRGETYGTSIKFRGPDYVKARLAIDRPRAFILHDARDTNHIARPLAQRLAHRGCLVWFRNFSLENGAQPSSVFADGVKQATCCILVVSPNLLKSPAWNAMEFHRIVAPCLRQPRLLHAVWYGVTNRQVREFSPALAERASLRWNLGPEQETVVKELQRALSF